MIKLKGYFDDDYFKFNKRVKQPLLAYAIFFCLLGLITLSFDFSSFWSYFAMIAWFVGYAFTEWLAERIIEKEGS